MRLHSIVVVQPVSLQKYPGNTFAEGGRIAMSARQLHCLWALLTTLVLICPMKVQHCLLTKRTPVLGCFPGLLAVSATAIQQRPSTMVNVSIFRPTCLSRRLLTDEAGISESLNYTSETFDCQLSFTYILLRVDSGSWITQTCFYCGGRLRTACILFYSLHF